MIIEDSLDTSFKNDSFDKTEVEKKNSEYVNRLLDEYPQLFGEIHLEDGSRVAVFYKNSPVSKEAFNLPMNYTYTAFSKHGVTEFEPEPEQYLGTEIIKRAMESLIRMGGGEEVSDLEVSKWKRLVRNRINKGLIPLKMVMNRVKIIGRHLDCAVEDFYLLLKKE